MKRIVVVGAGISGLATAYRIREGARARGQGLQLTVLEAEARAGGKIVTARREGFTVEGGPNGFLDGKPETLRLVDDLGLRDTLLESSDAARKRFVFRHGRLHALPESPLAFFRSRLLSVPGRLRILLEPWVAAANPELDETLAEFGRRRLGREAVEALLDPMVSGIHAGDPNRLSVWACFPRIKELERDYHSLIRALLAIQRQRRAGSQAAKSTAGGPGGPAGKLVSFRAGTETLVDALRAALGDSLRLASPVREVTARADGGYRVSVVGGGIFDADLVILAAPAHATAKILERSAPGAAMAVAEIPYAPATVVALGFDRSQVSHALDGFGFLIPGAEGRKILGSLWTSSIYPGHRAPEGRILLRSIVGGARTPELAGLPAEELVAMVRDELRRALGMIAPPLFTEIFRWPAAIPQYQVGHRDRVRRAEAGLAALPGVLLTGNAYRGVGINDCTREAENVAARALDQLAGP